MVYILDLTEVSHRRLNCASFQKCERPEGLEREKKLWKVGIRRSYSLGVTCCSYIIPLIVNLVGEAILYLLISA